MSIDSIHIKNTMRKWAKTEPFYHVMFWSILFIVMLILSMPNTTMLNAILSNSVNILFFALICYLDYFILFPKYLKDKKLIWHIGALVVISLLVTPIKTVVLYLASNGNFYYVDNQLFIFLSTFFVGISTTIYQIMNDWIVQQRYKSELLNSTLQSELKFLKSQINPHFLFNTLNSLYALTLKKSDLAPEIVLKLSEMMRYMLYECNEKEVLLSKEINYIQNYLELEKIRQGSKMTVTCDINGDISNQKLAPLILIPFIENSFKHGINSQISEGFVHLSLNVMNDDLQMVLENSKSPSLPKIGEKRSGGIGLVNVKRRMEILYPNQHQLDIMESPNTYQIELNIHLSNH